MSETIPEGKTHAASPEQEVLSLISNEILFEAVNALPNEQRDCILMRFIQGLSIAQTAAGSRPQRRRCEQRRSGPSEASPSRCQETSDEPRPRVPASRSGGRNFLGSGVVVKS
ncbi:sigma factor-like helix-turn-helix DNA-binding protein [Aeromicrobium sp. UC242_57]|uniref:sigma factor-like helix-turn-helix DNA-binding protein n=1 Tax=Aeromicrobium sp. UC242_57 TaxID=3374624 RepID=UPI00379883ED